MDARYLRSWLSVLVRASSSLRLWLLGLVGLCPASSQHLAGLESSKALTENLHFSFRVTLDPKAG